ncbi:hypothetical protein GALMADRAFT_74069 [Galerina marginata CBS 339.88]|uniref:Arabinan endo-1,5-alpha-L-arabinosidase n=1 Tax=Galerina marginata (strain CBS 339.88) TaxID=685588 RepID=A0A067SQB6_GALM3|nr:hypothetical protein GALMADRAFT_74069 [Galerina marginata CBS 339.88]
MRCVTLTSLVLGTLFSVVPSLALAAPTVSAREAAAAASYPAPITLKGSYSTHDPSALCKDSKGTYFMFSEGGMSTKTSTDRINWKDVGFVFTSAPWVLSYTGGVLDLWAPDCHYIDGKFHLYYAAATWGNLDLSAVFYATSTTGMPGSWTNHGQIISASHANYQAIDPTLIVDGSKWYLAFGSLLKGIFLLDPSTGLRSGSSITNIAQKSGVEEGAVIDSDPSVPLQSLVKVGSYYYLFVSVGSCCDGASSTYHVLVGRSKSITGPYLDESGTSMLSGGGTTILASHDSIHGPGGQSVFQDKDGWIIDYHYYPDSGDSLLGINHLDFSSGWPVVIA